MLVSGVDNELLQGIQLVISSESSPRLIEAPSCFVHDRRCLTQPKFYDIYGNAHGCYIIDRVISGLSKRL